MRGGLNVSRMETRLNLQVAIKPDFFFCFQCVSVRQAKPDFSSKM
jgi:hypothetical protein